MDDSQDWNSVGSIFDNTFQLKVLPSMTISVSMVFDTVICFDGKDRLNSELKLHSI